MPIDKFDTDNYRREQIEKFVKLTRLAKARCLNEKPFGMRGGKDNRMGILYPTQDEFGAEYKYIVNSKLSIHDSQKQTDTEGDMPESIRDILGEGYELD